VGACSEIESAELLVTDPENVEPSFKVTVACCWVAGAGVGALLQPHKAAITAITGITIFKRMKWSSNQKLSVQTVPLYWGVSP
jgi:hypothetical protein